MLLWGETVLNDGLTRDRIEELLLQLAQTYIKEVYVAYFDAGYYKYKDLTMKIDITQDLVSTGENIYMCVYIYKNKRLKPSRNSWVL